MIIGTYPGMLPATPFINRHIHAMALSGYTVYVFGTVNGEIKYDHSNIHVFARPEKRIWYILRALWQSMLLLILYPKRFYTYFNWAYKTKRSRPQMIRELPVVLHLPDVFHVQWARAAADWFFLKELFSVKMTMSLRGAQVNYSPVADKELARLYCDYFPGYDLFHAVCNAIGKEAMLYNAPHSGIRVIYSGVASSSVQKKNYGKQNTLNILSIGRMHWIKGYDYALQAMKILKQEKVNVHYTITGGGNAEEIVFLRHDMQLEDMVEILPAKPHDKILEAMTEYDVLLLPSVGEGIANVVIEAMSTGLPVISSDAGGMPELVTDGENGMLFPARDAKAMAASILRFYNMDAMQREAMAEKARASLKGKFDFDTFRDSFHSFYKELVK